MSKRGSQRGPQAHDGGPDLGPRLKCAGTDIEQRFDLGDRREHDGQAPVILVRRLRGHAIHDFLLQHEVHVARCAARCVSSRNSSGVEML